MKRTAPTMARIVVPNDDNTQKFITTRRYPIYYLAITKCASTYLKNVFYALDNDALHKKPSRIHDFPQDLERADRTPRWMIRRSPYAFAVIRNPVDRFMSFYFDKIHGTGPQNFKDLRAYLARQIDLSLDPKLDAAGHEDNCLRLLDWIVENLTHQTPQPVNPHWRPQVARIRAIDHVKPTFLTVDGLDDGLDRMLGPIVPNLAEVLAMVKDRNTTRYPVDKAAVLSQPLINRINGIYAEDAAFYARVKSKRETMRPARPVRAVGEGTQVLTTHRFGFNAVVQPKAGSSYVRNLFYRLDHGVAHPDPAKIDTDGCLVYRRKSVQTLKDEISFTIVRDPLERFFSLYFDKVWSRGPNAFPWVAETLERNRRFHAREDLSLAEHHDNCCRLLGFLENRFKATPHNELNPHWRPQALRLNQIKDMGFHALLLDGCGDQLRQLAGSTVRGLNEHLDSMIFRNESDKPIKIADLASPWIMERLHDLYEDDIAIFNSVKGAWDTTGSAPQL